MKQQFRRTAWASLVMVMSATALVACGGGDDPATAAAAGSGTTGVTITPTSSSANNAGGTITGNSFIDSAGGSYSTPSTSFGASSVTAQGSITLTGAPSYGGLLIGSTLAASTFNANSYSTLKIQLKSTTDTTIRVRLQPRTTDNTGCLPSKGVTVTSTLTEYTIPLNSTEFTQAFTCTYASGSDFASIKAAMGQIEVINEALAAGSHDVTIGTVKFQ